MKYHTDDVRITGMEEVAAPTALIESLPLSADASQTIFRTRAEAADILAGRDKRLLVVIGPCSIHDTEAALDYARRLAEQSQALRGELLIIMRTYFEKPRTTVGWKGLINDPHLDGTCRVNEGLRIARGVLRDIVDLGLGTGTEYLEPISPQYVGDLVSWAAIGARTTESQVHRQLASGLSCPVGFKNSTNGSVQVAVDAVQSASHSHVFLSVTKSGRSAIFETAGNPDCHVILRGGGGATNFDRDSIASACEALGKVGEVPRVMIDMSHANSQKKHANQLNVCDDLCTQMAGGSDAISGVMIESNLVEGNQSSSDTSKLTYGQSITDACIGWDDSVRVLADLAAASRARMA